MPPRASRRRPSPNLYLALDHNLELLPVINKIDLPAADVERVREEIEKDLGLDPFAAIPVSAKTGAGIQEVLAGIVEKLPCPKGDPAGPLKALVFDAQFDRYRGVIPPLPRHGRHGQTRRRHPFHALRLGLHRRGSRHQSAEIVSPREAQRRRGGLHHRGVSRACGRSKSAIPLPNSTAPAAEPVPGYQKAKQVVFSSIYPINSDEYRELTKALDKLAINDASLTYEKDSSAALGFGFRCGFLGLLHLDVVQERLQREFEYRAGRLGPVGPLQGELEGTAACSRSITRATGPIR